ncbi:SPFH domain-containing protein [Petroclostridium sp. X23]|uniref:flotillin family protein n=1 Tax=Petroclostridium sp. X23 TaxID=3045146 RepID=UPI0024AD2B4F|nr:SPFH domain-containing protein [Petroclostridium sp. X23]WHH60322.1 SPFH domain-containing protein [Petroclostridium sp. X23]
MELFIIPISIIGVIVLLLLGILSMWRKVSQDKALVVTGLKKRVISGGGGFVIPLLEKTDIISLENMKIEVRIDGALTEQGVAIIADGVAVIKVKSDTESILAAVEQFNTGHEQGTIEVIKDTSKDVLEGKLREIVSKMTVEDIYKDREKFASAVQEVAAVDLAEMGLEIKALTIRDISDINGYLEALGKKRIAEVKRDALIAEAEARKETTIKTAEADRLGAEAKLRAETQIAEATKEKELKVQGYQKEQQTAKAQADLAYKIEENKVTKEVTETELEVELLRRNREIDIAEREAVRKEKELEATIKKQADADKYMTEKQAEAIKYKEIQDAEARAEAIKLEGRAKAEAKKAEGMAEVDIIREKGKAEAEAMKLKAEAFKQYGEAAMAQMIVEKLPEISRAISEPLSKTEKIVIVDNGNGQGKGKGASKVTGYITDIISQLPETMEALTGVNLVDLLSNKKNTNETPNSNTRAIAKSKIIEEINSDNNNVESRMTEDVNVDNNDIEINKEI